jgi:hypothetical protein
MVRWIWLMQLLLLVELIWSGSKRSGVGVTQCLLVYWMEGSGSGLRPWLSRNRRRRKILLLSKMKLLLLLLLLRYSLLLYCRRSTEQITG